MIVIDDIIVSREVLEVCFHCDLAACRGACCIEGESGAPVLEEEVQAICDAYPHIEPLLPEENRTYIEEHGLIYTDWDGDLVTNIIDGERCVFTTFEPDGSARCAFEKAYTEGIYRGFYKPISCHLFPIRVQKLRSGLALNYSRWQPICEPARALGKREGVRLYRFLEAPLRRAFGDKWYDELLEVAEEYFRERERDE